MHMNADQLFVDKIVGEVKSQGVFDQFRKESMADVDTKPAYQNLRQRVESSVAKFLQEQDWKPDINKNQLREKLRKYITDAGYLDTGVERIVDQVVNPKISTVFQPKIEDIVYKYLGIQKPQIKSAIPINGNLEIETDLLPTDLEAVSPDSDKITSRSGSKEDLSGHQIDDNEDKNEEFESPPFEPIEGRQPSPSKQDDSNQSQISGISGLTSQDSLSSDNEIDSMKAESNNQETELSQVSSNSHLSIVTHDEESTDKFENTKDTNVDMSEEAQMPKFNENSKSNEFLKGNDLHFDILKEEIKFEGTDRMSVKLECKDGDTCDENISKLEVNSTNKNDAAICVRNNLEGTYNPISTDTSCNSNFFEGKANADFNIKDKFEKVVDSSCLFVPHENRFEKEYLYCEKKLTFPICHNKSSEKNDSKKNENSNHCNSHSSSSSSSSISSCKSSASVRKVKDKSILKKSRHADNNEKKSKELYNEKESKGRENDDRCSALNKSLRRKSTDSDEDDANKEADINRRKSEKLEYPRETESNFDNSNKNDSSENPTENAVDCQKLMISENQVEKELKSSSINNQYLEYFKHDVNEEKNFKRKYKILSEAILETYSEYQNLYLMDCENSLQKELSESLVCIISTVVAVDSNFNNASCKTIYECESEAKKRRIDHNLYNQNKELYSCDVLNVHYCYENLHISPTEILRHNKQKENYNLCSYNEFANKKIPLVVDCPNYNVKCNDISPISSESSLGSKENDFIGKSKSSKKKKILDTNIKSLSGKKTSIVFKGGQRYSNDDLYKPRPVVSNRSRRRGLSTEIA